MSLMASKTSVLGSAESLDSPECEPIQLQYYGGFMLDKKMSRREIRLHVKSIKSLISAVSSREIHLVVDSSQVKVLERSSDCETSLELKIFETPNIGLFTRCSIKSDSEDETTIYLVILYVIDDCHMLFLFSGPSEVIEMACETLDHIKENTLKDDNTEEFSTADLSYIVSWEMMECEINGNYAPLPRNSSFFKIRRDTNIQIILKVSPDTHNKIFNIDFSSCTSCSISIGKDKHSVEKKYDFDSIDFKVDDSIPGSSIIVCNWKLSTEDYDQIKTTSNADFTLLTVAFILKTKQFVEEIPFSLTHGLKVFPKTESLWSLERPKITFNYFIKLRKYNDDYLDDKIDYEYQYLGIYKASTSTLYEKFENMFGYFSHKNSVITQTLSIDSNESADIIPGTGEVVESLSEQTKSQWMSAINLWKTSKKQSFKMRKLLQSPIPNEFRKLVWPLLAGIHGPCPLAKIYEELLTESSIYETIIKKDLSRTFPLHHFFNPTHSSGQSSLFNVCKAYSLYDKDVGYVQGMSFIIAVLLLHVSEVNAFLLFVYIMETLNHRENFYNNFYHLHSKYFTVQKLLNFYTAPLADRMEEVSFLPHMYITNWFLTIFACKFPLNFIYTLMDSYLQKGEICLYKVSVLLILESEVPLNSSFDQFYQVICCDLQKKYLNHKNVLSFYKRIAELNISPSMIKEYTYQYHEILYHQIDSINDPVHLHKIKNRILIDVCARMDLINSQMHNKWEESKKDSAELALEYEENLRSMQLDSEEKTKQSDATIKELNSNLAARQNEISALRMENSAINKLYDQSKKTCEENSHTIAALQIQRDSIQNIWETEKRDIEKIINFCTRCSLRYRKMLDGDKVIDYPDSKQDSDDKGDIPKDDSSEHNIEDLQCQLIHAKMELMEYRMQVESLQSQNHKLEEKLKEFQNAATSSTSGWSFRDRLNLKK